MNSRAQKGESSEKKRKSLSGDREDKVSIATATTTMIHHAIK